ncbi:hypothetical protein [Streptomyces fulvoviolaceus]|uniref:hypothetical protein n=1 Tax=Streptomyces fulvoviolaceus TaxID=285535 RepID=UPI000694469D|nr:hypothetical protein [Streptomyces fulvoviolaceus]MCT9082048.1 hypothetical protein [Streptomyces fulvoviolaceus]
MTLPTTTPYDADRAAYSREDLARLVLCSQAVDTAGAAHALVATRNDVDTGLGGRVSEAVRLTQAAERTLVRAVVYERERWGSPRARLFERGGASWAEIGQYLGIGEAEAEERYAPELARWGAAFEVPYRLDPTGRKRVPRLPQAAYDPRSAVRQLDLWAGLHVTIRDRHAVSGGLAHNPAPHELDGPVRSRNLRTFLELLSGYLGYEFDDTDWDTIALGIEPTDDEEDVAAWYTYPLEGSIHAVRVSLAYARPYPEDDDGEPDTVSVLVAGADSGDLRLRIDTLITALAE